MAELRHRIDQGEIDLRREEEAGNTDLLTIYRAYAAGIQDDMLSRQQQKWIDRRVDHDVSDNVCRLILSTAASRLKLEQWRAGAYTEDDLNDDVTGPAEAVQAFLKRLWILNRMGRLQYETHYAFLRDGNAPVSLGWKNGWVRIARESWWDGEDGVFIAHTADGDPEWAVKEFTDRDPDDPKKTIRRRTLYFPDQIVRYLQRGSGWQEFSIPADPNTGTPAVEAVQDWAKRDGSPLGLPVINFPNGSSVSDSWYGTSDLVGLIGLQDDLNSMQADLSAASRFAGFQMITATGVPLTRRFNVSPGGMIIGEDAASRFGVIPPGDMSKLTDAHNYKRQTMSIDSATPMHTITGDWPSGAALLQARMPQVEKVERLGSVAGPQWTQVAHRATEIANAFGTEQIDENVPITAIFASAEWVDEATELDLQQKRVDVWDTLARLPKTAMLKTGLVTEDEADTIIAERDTLIGDFTPVQDERESVA